MPATSTLRNACLLTILALSVALLYALPSLKEVSYADELPCAEEISKFCKQETPGGGRILNCLDEHKDDLSATCRNKLLESRKRFVEAQKDCTLDIEKFCKNVQPGGGRIVKCLRDHAQDLASACKQHVDRTPPQPLPNRQLGY